MIHIGTDMVNVSRFAGYLTKPGFITRAFTPCEIVHCNTQSDTDYAFAKCFATKEACMKALGLGIQQGAWFTHIETMPTLRFYKRVYEQVLTLGVEHTEVSVTTADHLLIAVVILSSGAADGNDG